MFKVLDRNDQTNNQYDNDEIILLDNSSLACSIIRHKKRDMTMFRRLGEELEMLTSELDSFQIPPTILPHGAKYYQTQSSSNATINNGSLGGIRMDLRKSAGRSLLHRNDNHTMMKRQARKQKVRK